MLDEIDEFLDANREDFVRGWVQKGGQGMSRGSIRPCSRRDKRAAVAAAITWDAFN